MVIDAVADEGTFEADAGLSMDGTGDLSLLVDAVDVPFAMSVAVLSSAVRLVAMIISLADVVCTELARLELGI